MISHQHRCIYVHIPKTAGTSIESKLGLYEEPKYGSQDHRTILQIKPIELTLWQRLFGAKANPRKSDKKHHEQVTPKEYQTYFKFAFVRNPWARAYSWYRNIMIDPIKRNKLGVPEGCSFRDYLFNHSQERAMRSQLYWLLDEQKQMAVDFVGRFERLDEDFAKVAERLQLTDATLPKHNMSSNKQPSYISAYTDETREHVSQRYAEEIAYFGYTFEA